MIKLTIMVTFCAASASAIMLHETLYRLTRYREHSSILTSIVWALGSGHRKLGVALIGSIVVSVSAFLAFLLVN